jgi:hypothetical protein
LFICLSILRWYIHKDDQDLAIYGLELFSQIVRGDGCAGDLKCGGGPETAPGSSGGDEPQ